MSNHEAEARSLFDDLAPGEYILVKWNSEEEWSEALLLWPVTSKRWVILDPDQQKIDVDLSAEDINCFGSFGGVPKRLRGKTFYGLDEEDFPDSNGLKKMMISDYRAARKEVVIEQVIRCRRVYDFDSNLVGSEDFFGKLLPCKAEDADPLENGEHGRVK